MADKYAGRFASPAQRGRFGAHLRYIPPLALLPSVVVPGQSPTFPIGPPITPNNPATPGKSFLIQWTITVDPSVVGAQSWGLVRLIRNDNSHTYTHEFNDKANTSTFYLFDATTLFSPGITQQSGDIGVLQYTVGTGVTFQTYRGGVVIAGSTFSNGDGSVYDKVQFIPGIEPITNIRVVSPIPGAIPIP